MRKHLSMVILLSMMLPVMAQENGGKLRAQLVEAGEKVKAWDTEINMDTIDQEDLPKRVTGGIMLMANMSNFILFQGIQQVKSYMQVGVDVAGLVDFVVTKHFAIQGRLALTAEQNRFYVQGSQEHLWSFGFDLPVLFMGRFGNMNKGYLSFGAGPYTHFTFASNVGKYTNVETPTSIAAADELQTYALHDNHSGIIVSLGYEFPIGISILANYQVSLTDVVTFYKSENHAKGTTLYPQRVSLGIAYRWKGSKRKN